MEPNNPNPPRLPSPPSTTQSLPQPHQHLSLSSQAPELFHFEQQQQQLIPHAGLSNPPCHESLFNQLYPDLPPSLNPLTQDEFRYLHSQQHQSTPHPTLSSQSHFLPTNQPLPLYESPVTQDHLFHLSEQQQQLMNVPAYAAPPPPVNMFQPATAFQAPPVAEQLPPPRVPPFLWSGEAKASVRALAYLHQHNIVTISGQVECKRCKVRYEVSYDLVHKLKIYLKTGNRLNRFLKPKVPDPKGLECKECFIGDTKPVLPNKKRDINWLWHLLGQDLGFLHVKHLQYFIKHIPPQRKPRGTRNKTQLLILVVRELLTQLGPDAEAV